MTVNEPTLIKKASDNSLDDVIHAQKQLDEELQQLKNRYSRYSQLVSYQQEEEDYLLKNKEKVNPKRVSLSLKKKKDVTYGLMPHDDIFEKEDSNTENKKSLEDMTKTANAFLNSIKEKHNALKEKDFDLPKALNDRVEEKKKEEEEEKEKEEEEEEEHDHNMNRLCDLVQSLLSEAQDAIDTKPKLNHPDIGKEEEEEEEQDPEIPKRVQSLGYRRRPSVSSKHLSIMTDSTAVAQPLAPNNTFENNYDSFDNYDKTKYEKLNSPYEAMTSTFDDDDFMKGNNTSMMGEGMNYNPSKFYPPPEFYYGPAGFPPFFDPSYGPIPPYMWQEIQRQKMGVVSSEENSSADATATTITNHKEDQEIIKETTTTTTTTMTKVKKDKKEIVEGKALVKKRRHRRKHHRRIRPIDADGNLCEACPAHSKSLVVKKKQPSKLFKAQFGSDTQLFLSFFASFFVTSILVTISCLWSVIQVMAGNVNDKNLSRLLMSSSENAIQNNKKKIELILDKDSTESDSENEEEEEEEEEEEDGEEDLEEESSENQKLLTDLSTTTVHTHRRRNSL